MHIWYDPQTGRLKYSSLTSPRARRPQCTAKTREGRQCRARAVWDEEHNRPRNSKCRVHGGLSTGPRTAEGKARIAEAQRERWRAYRQAQNVETKQSLV